MNSWILSYDHFLATKTPVSGETGPLAENLRYNWPGGTILLFRRYATTLGNAQIYRVCKWNCGEVRLFDLYLLWIRTGWSILQ